MNKYLYTTLLKALIFFINIEHEISTGQRKPKCMLQFVELVSVSLKYLRNILNWPSAVGATKQLTTDINQSQHICHLITNMR